MTAVDHTRKLDLRRALGADRVVDYTTDDVTRSRDRYNLVFDVVGDNHQIRGIISHDRRDLRWIVEEPGQVS